jgi:hypothetical protein
MPDKDLLADWIRHATSDLTVARHLFENVYPRETEIIAYHSQQCAEKGAKIGILANFCARSFRLQPETAPPVKRAHDYSGSVPPKAFSAAPDEAIVQAALENAQTVYDFCLRKIKALENEY